MTTANMVSATASRFPLDGDSGHVLIDGSWRIGSGGAPVQVINPSTNDTLFEFVPASVGDVDAAVNAAWKAFRSSWSTLPGLEKGRCITRLADLMLDHLDTLAELEAADTGIPIKQSRFEVKSASRHFAYFAGLAGKIEGNAANLPDGRLLYGIREPLGVVAQIVPWNTPLKLLARGCAAALACGNTVVVKPSAVALASVLYLAKLAELAGFPPGVFNVVPGSGRTTGAALVRNEGIRKIVFTGGAAGGEEVLVDAARGVKPVLAELGGKGPIIVCDDADLDEAVVGVLSQSFARQGQVCFAGTRLFLPDSLHDDFVSRLAERANQIRVGNALDQATDMGPLISRDHLDGVVRHIERAIAEGSHLVPGGALPDQDEQLGAGNFLRPTILTDVSPTQTIAKEEVFGPVLVVHRYTHLDDAVAQANDTVYGLASYIWSTDLRRCHRLARDLEFGNVFINTYRYASEVPFGGYKHSGIGREHGLEALREYTQLKSVVVGLDKWNDPVISPTGTPQA